MLFKGSTILAETLTAEPGLPGTLPQPVGNRPDGLDFQMSPMAEPDGCPMALNQPGSEGCGFEFGLLNKIFRFPGQTWIIISAWELR